MRTDEYTGSPFPFKDESEPWNEAVRPIHQSEGFERLWYIRFASADKKTVIYGQVPVTKDFKDKFLLLVNGEKRPSELLTELIPISGKHFIRLSSMSFYVATTQSPDPIYFSEIFSTLENQMNGTFEYILTRIQNNLSIEPEVPGIDDPQEKETGNTFEAKPYTMPEQPLRKYPSKIEPTGQEDKEETYTFDPLPDIPDNPLDKDTEEDAVAADYDFNEFADFDEQPEDIIYPESEQSEQKGLASLLLNPEQYDEQTDDTLRNWRLNEEETESIREVMEELREYDAKKDEDDDN